MENANAFVHSFVTDIDMAHTFALDQLLPVDNRHTTPT